jgi:hypothetical protein
MNDHIFLQGELATMAAKPDLRRVQLTLQRDRSASLVVGRVGPGGVPTSGRLLGEPDEVRVGFFDPGGAGRANFPHDANEMRLSAG